MPKPGSGEDLADQLIRALPYGQPGLFNPWVDQCADDMPANGPSAKRARLAAHLNCTPKFVLFGEAAGYQGCRHSGIAFTSERLLLEGKIPRVETPHGRLTKRELPFSEPSATIVWRSLAALGIEGSTVLWNALQLHPYKDDNTRSNRTPTPDEMRHGERAVKLIVEAYPRATLVAIGKKAEQLLQDMGIKTAGAIRHPANGGATKFHCGLTELVRTKLVLAK